jgi:hypothetical protein
MQLCPDSEQNCITLLFGLPLADESGSDRQWRPPEQLVQLRLVDVSWEPEQ